VQALEDVHDTLSRWLVITSGGLGFDWIDHTVPFQVSVNASTVYELFWYSPTAVHAVEEAHDTPFRYPSLAPVGLGIGWIDHSLPFQRSTKAS
jgi:hypothetical protein